MALQPLREESPKWLEILQYLADNGGTTGPGCRVRQAQIAVDVGLNRKNLQDYLKAMEQYEIITVRRTTVDGSFGSPRGFNIITLHCSPARWRDELGPALAAERRRRVQAHRAVLNRNNAREQQRKRLQAKLAELGPTPGARPAAAARAPGAATRVVDPEPTFAPEDLPAIVARYDEPGVDLNGW